MNAIITEIQHRSQSFEEDIDEAMEASEHIAAAEDDNDEDEGSVFNIRSKSLIAAMLIIFIAIMMKLSFL